MKADQIEVNGAVMDRAYFDENVQEASELQWQRIDPQELAEHHHCMVCTTAVSRDSGEVYRAGARYLCGYCRKTFIR